MILHYLCFFLVFMFIQAIFINGVYLSMEEGMIFNKFKKWIISKGSFASKPFFVCIKCSASVGGAISFWPTVVYLFGLHWIQIPIFIADVFCLVYINFYVYKKI